MKKMGMVLMLMLVSTSAFAGGDHPHEPYTGSAAFEKLKTLVGSWEGTFSENMKTGKESPANK